MASTSSAARELSLRVIVVQAPTGVMMQVQPGRDELLPPTRVTEETVTFEFSVRVRDSEGAGPPRLLGQFAQGPPKGRFVYVNSGKRAGQVESCWDRRAKVSLMAITAAQVEAALEQPGAVLEARIGGIARDGGPACATVPLLGDGWRVVRSSAV